MSHNERAFKTAAIVIRRADFGETDLLLTLYTPQYGKISAVAKGARKPTARLTGQVELYARTELLIHRGRDLHIVTQAESHSSHAIFQENFERSLFASHFTELIDRFSLENEENRPAYKLLSDGLNWLAQPDLNLRVAARYYEYRTLRVMGYGPSLFECVIGEEALEACDQFFSPVDGGVVCPEHAAGRDFMRLTLPAFKVLRHFSRNTWASVGSLELEPRLLDELERILHTYLIYLLERRLQSAAFLRKITQDAP